MHSYRNFLMLVLLFLGIGTTVSGSTFYRDITTVGTSAEMIGIGSIQGFSHEASVLLESPAGLGYAGNSVSGFYTSYFGDTQYMTGAISFVARPELTVGIGAAYERSADLDFTATNNANEHVVAGQFGVDTVQLVAGVNYHLLNDLHVGASWTEYLSNIYDVHGSGSDMSVGLLYQTKVGDILVNGKNIFCHKISFNDGTSEQLASQWSLGFKSAPMPFMDSEFFVQAKQIQGFDDVIKSAGIRLYPLSTPCLALSIGYKERPGISDVKETMTAGVVLNLGTMSISYGYDTTDVYQDSQQHYVSLALKY